MNFQGLNSFGKHKKQNGFSLIDAVLWFALLGIGVAVLYSKFHTSLGSAKSTAERDTFQIVISQVKKVYMGGGTATAGDITATLIAKGNVFSKPFTVSGTTVSNAYGGAVTVVDNGSTFTLTSTGYPTDICTDLAQSPGDWISVSANGTALTMPVNLQAAVTACSTTPNTIAVTSTK
jgi:type II secretory pathway pseudopilin PulG